MRDAQSLHRSLRETPVEAVGRCQLGFNMEAQRQDQWCWAAVSTGVSHYYQASSVWHQCLLVNRLLGQTTCCQNGASGACDRPYYLDHGLSAVGHDGGITSGAIGFDQVRSEIDNGRPVGCFIGWNSGGVGHFVIIEGYREDASARRLQIEDSLYGSADYDYETFRHRYLNARGSWQWIYFTR